MNPLFFECVFSRNSYKNINSIHTLLKSILIDVALAKCSNLFFVRIHSINSVLMYDPKWITYSNFIFWDSIIVKDSSNAKSSCSSSINQVLTLFTFFLTEFQWWENSSQNCHSCSMLVIVENWGNLNLLQFSFDEKTWRSRNVL